MTETQLWTRLAEALGDDYCRIWAAQQAVPGLDSRTVQEALADGVDAKTIWRTWGDGACPDAEERCQNGNGTKPEHDALQSRQWHLEGLSTSERTAVTAVIHRNELA